MHKSIRFCGNLSNKIQKALLYLTKIEEKIALKLTVCFLVTQALVSYWLRFEV